MISDLKTLVHELGISIDRAIAVPSEGVLLDHKFDVSPEDFLEQAELDYERGGNSALLNSITNAKRAILSQIDKIVYSIGFDASKMKIKEKSGLLRNIGFVAPRILRRVYDPRNLLEHEYVNPPLAQVEEALDLASLFCEATNRSSTRFGKHFTIGNEDEYISNVLTGTEFVNELCVGFNEEQKLYMVDGYKDTAKIKAPMERKSHHVSSVSVMPTNKAYLDLLRISVVVEKDREHKTKETVQQFLANLTPAL